MLAGDNSELSDCCRCRVQDPGAASCQINEVGIRHGCVTAMVRSTRAAAACRTCGRHRQAVGLLRQRVYQLQCRIMSAARLQQCDQLAVPPRSRQRGATSLSSTSRETLNKSVQVSTCSLAGQVT